MNVQGGHHDGNNGAFFGYVRADGFDFTDETFGNLDLVEVFCIDDLDDFSIGWTDDIFAFGDGSFRIPLEDVEIEKNDYCDKNNDYAYPRRHSEIKGWFV